MYRRAPESLRNPPGPSENPRQPGAGGCGKYRTDVDHPDNPGADAFLPHGHTHDSDLAHLMAIGWAGVPTHFGVIMKGSRSTRARIISKERLPDPMMIEARNSVTGMPEARRISLTSWRLCRCAERWEEASPSPPR